jgi:cation transport ATPase
MTVKTTALSEDSAVARMVRLVEEAQTQRSHTELLVEKLAKYYTPGMFINLSNMVTCTIKCVNSLHLQKVNGVSLLLRYFQTIHARLGYNLWM